MITPDQALANAARTAQVREMVRTVASALLAVASDLPGDEFYAVERLAQAHRLLGNVGLQLHEFEEIMDRKSKAPRP